MLEYGEVTAVRKNEITIKLDENVIDKVLRFREENKRALVELRLNDTRCVTNEQRKKYFATLKDIAEHTGNYIEFLHDYFKITYCFKNKVESISMSNCSITEAREMINIVMDFVIENDIPLKDLGVNRTDDISRYLYSCLVNRRCSITGKSGAHVHHCTQSRVGMGNNRNKVNHVGRYAIALSLEYHNMIHNMGEKDFFKKYKVYGIKLDDYLVKKLNL